MAARGRAIMLKSIEDGFDLLQRDEDNIDETDEEIEAGLYSLIGDIESIVLECLDGIKMIG